MRTRSKLKGMNDKGEVLVASEAIFVTVTAPEPTATATQPPPATATVAPTAAPRRNDDAAHRDGNGSGGHRPRVKEGNDFVNVRKGPATGYDKLGTLDKGAKRPCARQEHRRHLVADHVCRCLRRRGLGIG